ncbi:MAG TPA: hypothetical protein PL029_00375 [Bacteroidia bacterium]|nr:hypothetical protein [Bacteroidia bacterium]
MTTTSQTAYLIELHPVEIFRTNVLNSLQAQVLIAELLRRFPWYRINFDLEDRDRILRVEGQNILPHQIIALLNSLNFDCEIIQ